ncbi:IS6 family transposase [Methylobacterium nodulans]|uniref:Putative insertion sequence transposase-like protein n=1 Tax=Methylobacterium nodulans (strain LMG 21967 / CNCM I-2342 / ORS 2060) TaxID=460265 RepID=B8IXP3_METNO|nr:IS6 family transposase [Methylobacterium nodulans]ACL62875.1 putative insertion sequence transposase-like protein [Methylobacterium nodulans ORS 2060]
MILNALALTLKRQAQGDFRGRHFEATLIVQAVSWSLRDALSDRDIAEMLLERGLTVDHSTLTRWVLADAPAIERRLRRFRKPPCGSVRVDETDIRVRGQWRSPDRAIDKPGEAVDVLLTANRDLDAAKRLFRNGAGPYPPAIAESRKAGLLPRTPTHHVSKPLQQGIASDPFRVKRAMPRVGGFRSFKTARRTIQGVKARLWRRKGFGFLGAWTVREQNQLLAHCFGLPVANKA